MLVDQRIYTVKPGTMAKQMALYEEYRPEATKAASRRTTRLPDHRIRRGKHILPHVGLPGCCRPSRQTSGHVRGSGMADIYSKECRGRLFGSPKKQSDDTSTVRPDEALVFRS